MLCHFPFYKPPIPSHWVTMSMCNGYPSSFVVKGFCTLQKIPTWCRTREEYQPHSGHNGYRTFHSLAKDFSLHCFLSCYTHFLNENDTQESSIWVLKQLGKFNIQSLRSRKITRFKCLTVTKCHIFWCTCKFLCYPFLYICKALSFSFC